MNLTIRPAVPADAPVLLDIERESFTHPHWTGESFLKYQCIVAEVEGKAVGFVVSREVFSGGAGIPAEREIMNLAVTRAYRRLGIASSLLQAVLDKKASYFLEVRESNNSAQKLYEKFGFVPVGTRKGYYQQPQEAAIVMHMKWC